MMTKEEIYQNAMVALLQDYDINCKLANRGRDLGCDELAEKFAKSAEDAKAKIEWLRSELEKLQEVV